MEGTPVFKELVEYVAKVLVDQPDQVHVEAVEDSTTTTLRLRVAPGDLGRVIGKQGPHGPGDPDAAARHGGPSQAAGGAGNPGVRQWGGRTS